MRASLRPRAGLDALDWAHMHAVLPASAGSGGVFYVVCDTTCECIVLKASAGVAAEVAADVLAEAIGAPVPAWRLLLGCNGSEILHAQLACLRLLATRAGVGEDALARRSGEGDIAWLLRLAPLASGGGRLAVPCYRVMRFVPRFLPPPLSPPLSPQVEAVSGSLCTTLGAVIALDVLTNGWDRWRIPLLWNAPEGNAGNWLVTGDGAAWSAVVALDSAVTCLHGAAAAAYLERATAFSRVMHERDGDGGGASGVARTAALRFVLDDLWLALGASTPVAAPVETAAVQAIADGFAAAVRCASATCTDAWLGELVAKLNEQFAALVSDFGALVSAEALGLNRVDAGFLRDVLRAVEAGAPASE